MAKEFAEYRFQFLFVYTREAHPSDRFPGHNSMMAKLEHARTMVQELGFERSMLVDKLEGDVHAAYGRLPNMSYIVDVNGTIIYRAAWTDPVTIRTALEQILFVRDERRAKRRVTPYFMEGLPHRANDDVRFVKELHDLGGARPVDEYIAAMEHLEGHAATKRIREWWTAKSSETP